MSAPRGAAELLKMLAGVSLPPPADPSVATDVGPPPKLLLGTPFPPNDEAASDAERNEEPVDGSAESDNADRGAALGTSAATADDILRDSDIVGNA